MIERKMSARTVACYGAMLALSSCGYIGLELRDLPAPEDGGLSDAQVVDASLDASDDAAREGGSADASSDATSDSDAATLDGALSDAAASDAAAADGGDAGQDATCDLSGTWAVKITSSLSWPGGLIEASSGTGSTWLLYQGTQSGSSWTGTTQVCGFAVPDFRLNPGLGDETYGLRVPNTLFDRAPPYIPTVAASIAIGGAGAMGDVVTTAPQVFVVGARLTNPLTDAWPANTALMSVDHEMDGQPGVTANYASDATRVFPPLNFMLSQRADRSYFAVRLSFSSSATITSCTQLDGSATFSFFDTHILGCHIAGGANCGSAQRDFLDNNRPLYAPSASTLRAIQVPANTLCSQVRTALP